MNNKEKTVKLEMIFSLGLIYMAIAFLWWFSLPLSWLSWSYRIQFCFLAGIGGVGLKLIYYRFKIDKKKFFEKYKESGWKGFIVDYFIRVLVTFAGISFILLFFLENFQEMDDQFFMPVSFFISIFLGFNDGIEYVINLIKSTH